MYISHYLLSCLYKIKFSRIFFCSMYAITYIRHEHTCDNEYDNTLVKCQDLFMLPQYVVEY